MNGVVGMDLLVKDTDGLYRSKCRMSLEQHKLLAYLAWRAEWYRGETGAGMVTCKVEDSRLCGYLGVSANLENSEACHKIYKSLMRKKLNIMLVEKDGPPSFIKTHWAEGWAADEDFEWFSEMRLRREVYEYLMQQRDVFRMPRGTADFEHPLIIRARSPHTYRLYEILKAELLLQYNVMRLSLRGLRWALCIGGDEWKRYAVFKKRVILKAQEEMRRYCDIRFEFEEIVQDGHVEGIKFTILWNDERDGIDGDLRDFYRELNAGKKSPLDDIFTGYEKTTGIARARGFPLLIEEEENPHVNPTVSAGLIRLLGGPFYQELTKQDMLYLFDMLGMVEADNRVDPDRLEELAKERYWDEKNFSRTISRLAKLGILQQEGPDYYFNRDLVWPERKGLAAMPIPAGAWPPGDPPAAPQESPPEAARPPEAPGDADRPAGADPAAGPPGAKKGRARGAIRHPARPRGVRTRRRKASG